MVFTLVGYWARVRGCPRPRPIRAGSWWTRRAGQSLALAAATGWVGVLLAFALFRAFDILKPGPVGWADRQKGPFGVMADDVIAGAMAAAVLLLLAALGLP
ncbi:phosphatidylglycerophosphatase A [Roseococcus sp.]|uniref:phosphatidylglycerophosphatase A family protein n=1 Tax=Roseococcus sp. TaxID=2109646 RepID=UPI003BAA0B91